MVDGWKPSLGIDQQRLFSALVMLIFALGLFTLIALVFGALVLAAYVLNLFLNALIETQTAIAMLYTHGDNWIKLILWLVAVFLIVRMVTWLLGLLRNSSSSHTWR